MPRSGSVGGHFFDANLQRGEPGFEVGRVGHGEQRTDLCARRQGVGGVPVEFRSCGPVGIDHARVVQASAERQGDTARGELQAPHSLIAAQPHQGGAGVAGRLTRGRPRRAVDGQAQRQPPVGYQK